MKQHRLTIIADNQPTMLEQLLRVTRYRGFKVVSLSMQVSQQADSASLQLTVKSERSISLLLNQLLKLVDIKQVNEDLTIAESEPIVLQQSEPEQLLTEAMVTTNNIPAQA